MEMKETKIILTTKDYVFIDNFKKQYVKTGKCGMIFELFLNEYKQGEKNGIIKRNK